MLRGIFILRVLRRIFRAAKPLLDDHSAQGTGLGSSSRQAAVIQAVVPVGDVTWKDYELAAGAFLRQVGYAHVIDNHLGADGGVDVEVPGELVGQVKYEQSKTGRPQIQQISGIAMARGVKAVFFAHAGYSQQATAWAENTVALFILKYHSHHESWEVRPVNDLAKQVAGQVPVELDSIGNEQIKSDTQVRIHKSQTGPGWLKPKRPGDHDF